MITLVLSLSGVTLGILAVFLGIEVRRAHADRNPMHGGRI